MFRWLLICLLLCCCLSSSEYAGTAISKNFDPSVDVKSSNYYCKGNWISQNEVLSAAHCSGKSELIDGNEAYEELIDTHKDLMILHSKEDIKYSHSILELSDHNPNIGEVAVVFGREIKVGTVKNYFDHFNYGGEGGSMDIRAPIRHGDSGGAVVDSKGKLVGIISFIYEGELSHGFAVDLSTIKLFIKENSANPRKGG